MIQGIQKDVCRFDANSILFYLRDLSILRVQCLQRVWNHCARILRDNGMLILRSE